MALPQGADTVGELFDAGALPQQQTDLVKLKRRKVELLQALADKMTGYPVPRNYTNPDDSGKAFARAGLERFTNNITGLPDLAVTALMSIPNKVINDAKNFGNLPELLGYPRTTQGPLPKMGERVIPGMPDAMTVFAGAQRLGEGVAALTTGDWSQFKPDPRAQQQLISEGMAQKNPIATMAGGIAGDVATLGALRNPVAGDRAMAHVNQKRALIAKEADQLAAKEALVANKATDLSALGIEFAPSLKSALTALPKTSKGFSTLLNQTGRSAEAGVEGAVLSILNDGDPMETAAFAAGGQAAGSLMLGGLTGLFSGGPLAIGSKLALSAVSVGAILQTVKSVTPGGQDFSLESVESGFNKVALGVAAGAIAGIAGAGRVTSKFPVTALPKIADAISALPRAATLSVLNDALNNTQTEKVISQLAQDPNYFGPAAGRRLERAFRNPDISINSVIEDLMEQKPFREKLAQLDAKK